MRRARGSEQWFEWDYEHPDPGSAEGAAARRLFSVVCAQPQLQAWLASVGGAKEMITGMDMRSGVQRVNILASSDEAANLTHAALKEFCERFDESLGNADFVIVPVGLLVRFAGSKGEALAEVEARTGARISRPRACRGGKSVLLVQSKTVEAGNEALSLLRSRLERLERSAKEALDYGVLGTSMPSTPPRQLGRPDLRSKHGPFLTTVAPWKPLRLAAGGSPGRSPSVERVVAALQGHTGLCVRNVAADGNCMFRAVSVALRADEDSHLELRELAVNTIVASKDLHPFVEGDQHDPSRVERHIRVMRAAGTFGAHVELHALAQALGLRITVWSWSGEAGVLRPESMQPAKPQEELRDAEVCLLLHASHYQLLYP